MTQEIQKTPQQSAEEFVELMGFLSKPSANPVDEVLESISGGGLTVRSFIPGDQRTVSEELASKVKGRAENLLGSVPITQSFKDHIQELVQSYLESGMIRMTGTRFIIEQCGVDLSTKKYGIFSEDEAGEVEKEAIRLNYPPRSMFTDVVVKHNQKMDRWIQEYTQTHQEDPLQD